MEHDDAGGRFAGRVESFLEFLGREAPQLDVDARLARTAVHLAELVALALLLPDEPAAADTPSYPRALIRASAWTAGPRRAYFRTPDADTGSVERGDLDEDLEDLQAELILGLTHFRAGTEESRRRARLHWRGTFLSHWGHHAVEALRAIHYRTGGRAG